MSTSECVDIDDESNIDDESICNEDFDKFNKDLDNELLWVRSTRYASDNTSDDEYINNKNNTSDNINTDSINNIDIDNNIIPSFPWHKESTISGNKIYSASSGSLRTGEKMLKDVSKNSCANLTHAITNMLTSVKKRENQIRFFFEIAKFENIEHFLDRKSVV